MNEFKRVSKRAKTKWFLDRLIGLIFLVAIFVPVMVISDSLTLKILAAAAVLAQLLNMLIYPQFEYIQWSYRIGDDCIEIKKGVFWRSHTVIPISRIQHVCASSGPIQRMFGLSNVLIHTAGGQHRIEQLSTDVAQEMCAALQNVVNTKVEAQRAAAAAAASATFIDPNAEVKADV